MNTSSTHLLEPVANQEAIDFIKSKPVVSQEVFAKLLPELKGRVFTISGIEDMNILQKVRDRIADLPAGANWNDVRDDIATDLSPFFVDENADPETKDAQINAANRRAELLLRTHGFQAYQAAQYDVMKRQVDVFEYWQYMTMEDDAVRPEHAALDGLILPADSSFWDDHYPPWDWGCRCLVRAISAEEAQAAGTEESGYGWTLTGQQQAHLEENGFLPPDADNNGIVTNVSSPVDRGDESPFSWNPGDLRIPVEQLQTRYDADIWMAFEKWAKARSIEGGKNLWNWLTEGKKG
jgi:SPP1 gp7 family putative phage head morphogenesis protein